MNFQNIILISSTEVIDSLGRVSRGGAEIYIVELAKLARDLGYSVAIIQCGKVSIGFEWQQIHIKTVKWESKLLVRQPRSCIR